MPLVTGILAAGWLMVAGCEPSPLANDPEAPPEHIYAGNTHSGSNFVPNPDFHPLPAPAVQSRRLGLREEGEVIVLEGDARFVASNGTDFGITQANQEAIVQEVVAEYGDVFDTIQIYLTFTDAGNIGTAYYQPIRSNVNGIGRMSFNGRAGWGLPPEGRLSGFSNMNDMSTFGGLRQAGTAFSGYHAVVAQELSHRWLFFFTFQTPSGQSSQQLLGRDDAHWSRLAQAYGSVQDGNEYEQVADADAEGFAEFIKVGQERGFAPLDLYGMGVLPPEEVDTLGPIWYINEATNVGTGDMLDRNTPVPAGARVRGKKIDVPMQAIINELGPRDPPAGTEDPYYRVALVLVTAPGQPSEEWQPFLEQLQALQVAFVETWKEWSTGASSICLKITERCPEPRLDLQGHAVTDGNDNLLAPNERFDLTLSIRNDGLGTTENVAVELEAITEGVTVETAGQTVASIGENKVADVPPFSVQLSESVACGDEIDFRVTMRTEEGPKFVKRLSFTIGNRTVKFDPLNEGPDWRVNPTGEDEATAGVWDLGVPEFVSVLGVVTQPAADQTAGEGDLAFMTGSKRGLSQTANDVDDGTTTLESPLFAIGETLDPSLVFYYWRVARDFTKDGNPPIPGADLVVYGSRDGGATFVEMDRITEDSEGWTRRTIRIRDTLEPSDRMRFRFEITDPSSTGIVEAGIDDLEIIDVLEECIEDVPAPTPTPTPMDEGGCRCVNSQANSSLLALCLLLPFAAVPVLRRKRS